MESQTNKINYQVVYTNIGRIRIKIPRLRYDSEYATKLKQLVESPKKGRGQKAAMLKGRGLRTCPMPLGSRAPNFSYEKQRKYVFRDAKRSYILRPC